MRGADVWLAPGRERLSDIDTTSYDDRRSGSISFAPPRRVKDNSSRVKVLESFTRRNSDVEPSEALSQRSVYYDAQDAQAPVSQGPSRSANSSPSLPNTSPSKNDCSAELRSPGRGFKGPGGSPRHPGLKEYDTLPPTHPILSRNSTRRNVYMGENDQEGMR